MPNKEELERKDLNFLAVLCQRVAAAQPNSTEAHQARQLKDEWTALLAPPMHSPKMKEDRESRAQRLKQKMVSFLAVALPPD